MTSTRTRTSAASAALALAALLLAGCAGGDVGAAGESAGGTADAESSAEALDEGLAYDARGADGATADRPAAVTGSAPGAAQRAVEAVRSRAVVSTGSVSLEADDVGDALFDVRRVVDEAGGEVSDEETGTDRAGEVRRSRLVVRVPVGSFDEAMTALGALDSATLRSAQRESEDVTTQVIDVEARLRAQRASLERVELLLARAEDLRDVVAVEAQLTRRQADLDSLQQQQAFLTDQTSLATITVHLERPAAGERTEPDDDGFVAGLAAGWDALAGTTTTLLTAAGAVLPFVLVLGLLGLPAWWLARRLGGRVSAGAAARTP